PNGTCTNPPVPHATTVYDEGMSGLGAVYYAGPEPTGGPALHATGIGGNGTLFKDWGATVPPGLNATPGNWSLRLNGEINFPAAGNPPLQIYVNGAARVFLDDKVVLDNWVSPAIGCSQTATNVPGTVGRHRFAVDFRPMDNQNAHLEVKRAPPPAGTWADIP